MVPPSSPWLVALFFALLTAYSMGAGLTGLAFMDMVAKAIPPTRRGGFFAQRSFWGGLLALAVGVPATLYVQYAFGQTGHFFWGKSVAKFPFSLLARHMDAYGRPMTEWHAFSFAHIDPNPDFLWAAGVGLAAVLVVSFLRLRYTWWPIHPVMFLVFGVDTVTPLCASFLVGWAIKTGVMRFGGSRVYRAGKPVFVGLIAGEFVAGLLWAAGGLARYLAEGTHVEVLRVHPF